jgi:hypothetical protein
MKILAWVAVGTLVLPIAIGSGCGVDRRLPGERPDGAGGSPVTPDGGPGQADARMPEAGGGGAGGGGGMPLPGTDGGTDSNPPPPADGGQPPPGRTCSDLFNENIPPPSYYVDISADEWASLMVEFHDVAAVQTGNPPENYHPITFRFGAETVTNAMIRLKGQSSWVATIQNDAHPKAQFVIAFDQVNTSSKFHGLGKLDFDMPRSDWTFLNERLANNWLRQVGIMAPCAASGKLYINNSYYGVYVTEETKGDHLIKQFFPTPPVGDFIKGGTTATNNPGMTNTARLRQFQDATDINAVAAIVDIQSSILEWAAEAVLNDADGYYGGGHNFYIYDQGPAAGYVFIPTDVDSSIEWLNIFSPGVSYHQHPIYWWVGRGSATAPPKPSQHYRIVMGDQQWRARYVDAIATRLQQWDVAEMQSWVDSWSQQISEAVNTDPNKAATFAQFQSAIVTLRSAVSQRPAYLQTFLDCEHGQGGADADGDGVRWCDDCRDDNASIHPGAQELCNGVDDNCDGLVDEGCPPPPPADAGAPASADAGTG